MNYGWTYDAGRISEGVARLATAGQPASNSLRGYWKRLVGKGIYYVSAQDAEKAVTGKWRKPNYQSRGTCVGQGSSRAIEDTHYARLASRQIVGKPVQVVYEVMYGYERHEHYSRTQSWGTRGNCNDGLQGVDAAAFYSLVGCLARGKYDSYDLTEPREELAIKWNNEGVPKLLLAACAFHKISNHVCQDWDEYADSIAAECYGHICLPMIFGGGKIGKYNTVEPDGSGGHCTECCGVFLLPDLTTGFHIQQSWGDTVRYPDYVETAGGRVSLRPGSYVVRQKTLENMGHQVERVACDIPSGSSFR